MKIFFSGGGTLGPVTPLLAIYDAVKKACPQAEFFWVGTKSGPERDMVEKSGIKFIGISSGKLRRYFSFWNLTDLFKIKIGFLQSLKLLSKEKPDACISAGGFVSVPLHWAARVLGIKTWVHQQDRMVSISIKLMSRFADLITTALEVNAGFFPKNKTIWLGNPVRREILRGDKEEACRIFAFKENLPVLFVTGGGTGSLCVNQLVLEALPFLKGACNIIHLFGKERPGELVKHAESAFSDYYKAYSFFTEEMKHAYAIADIIVSRGGFGSLAEIAALGKPAIIIPKPGHQVENVEFLESSDSVIYIDEKAADGNVLANAVMSLLHDKEERDRLSANIQNLLPVARDEEILGVFQTLIKS